MTEIARLQRGECAFYRDPNLIDEEGKFDGLDGIVAKFHSKPTPGGYHVTNHRSYRERTNSVGTVQRIKNIVSLNVCKKHGEEIYAKALEGLTEKEDYDVYQDDLVKIVTEHRMTE